MTIIQMHNLGSKSAYRFYQSRPSYGPNNLAYKVAQEPLDADLLCKQKCQRDSWIQMTTWKHRNIVYHDAFLLCKDCHKHYRDGAFCQLNCCYSCSCGLKV